MLNIAKIFFLSLAILLSLASCSLLQRASTDVYDYAQKKYSFLQVDNSEPIDSLVIRFEPVYWIDSTESSAIETETTFQADGYDVWILKTGGAYRYEVQRKDSIIYFYEAK